LAWSYYFARRFEEADRMSRQTLAIEPDFPYSHMQRGMNLIAEGRASEALEELRRFRSLSGDSPLARALTAYAQAVHGQKREALSALREMHELSRQRYLPAYPFAIVYAGLGEADEAIRWLEKAADQREGAVVLFAATPLYDFISGDPRFQDLVRRLRRSTRFPSSPPGGGSTHPPQEPGLAPVPKEGA
jgi:tetratricopeptide (TPR) repeat protein